jgi:hypothetical protein
LAGEQERTESPATGGRRYYHSYYLALLLGWSDMRLPGLFTVAEPLLRLSWRGGPGARGSTRSWRRGTAGRMGAFEAVLVREISPGRPEMATWQMAPPPPTR